MAAAHARAGDDFDALIARFDPSALRVPHDRALVRLVGGDGAECDVIVRANGARRAAGRSYARPDAVLSAGTQTWAKLGRDLSTGMAAYRSGHLRIKGSLHIGVGFLAATAAAPEATRLRMLQTKTRLGTVSTLVAGAGPPVLMLHGLGATKASFLPTVAALAPRHRCIAIDLPGFGDSDKPLFASYNPAFFARWITALLDSMDIDRADVIGHSMGGRAAIELGLRHPDRVDRLALMMPSLAWRRNREWAALLRLVRPELGMLQITPRPVVERFMDWLIPEGENHWVATAKDEFLRSFLTPSGRAAFYAAGRHIYLEAPEGPHGFWPRLRELSVRSMFIWGRQDRLVPRAFRRHVAEMVPAARHVELNCGHVPQLEAPRELHEAIERFLG